MRVVFIKEKRMDELVEATLDKLQNRCLEEKGFGRNLDPDDAFRLFNYQLRVLVDALKEDPVV